MTGAERIAIVEQAIARYNAQDADGYAAFFAADGCEALYRGDVLRAGRDAVRDGNATTFAEFPQNRAEIAASYALGDHVVLHEVVHRAADVAPFEVISIYTFDEDRIARVEFVK